MIKQFEDMGKIIGDFFDNDMIDIGRESIIIDPESGADVIVPAYPPMYTGVKCHLSYDTQDNPDTNTVGTTPKIQSIQIDCSTDTDLRNDDLVTAYRINSIGDIMEQFEGRINQPTIYNSRTTAILAIQEG